MAPADWVTIFNLAQKCSGIADNTEFWSSHSKLKPLQENAILYCKQVEHRARLLEKTPRNGCGDQLIEVKGLIRAWDPTKSLPNQNFEAIILNLEFDKGSIQSYRDLARHFAKFKSGWGGLTKVIEYAELELKYTAEASACRS